MPCRISRPVLQKRHSGPRHRYCFAPCERRSFGDRSGRIQGLVVIPSVQELLWSSFWLGRGSVSLCSLPRLLRARQSRPADRWSPGDSRSLVFDLGGMVCPLRADGSCDDRGRRDPLSCPRASLRLLERNPWLASELAIGRPDLPRRFDDGGLVDVNHVLASVLASLSAVDIAMAERIVTMREHIGSYDSTADVEIVLDLPPTQLDQARELMIFRRE